MPPLGSAADLVRTTVLIVAALFPIVNPLGGAPIFLTMTSTCTSEVREDLARRVAINGFVLLAVSIFTGKHILGFFGISIPVMQVAGGLVLGATAWVLLRQGEAAPKAGPAEPWTQEQIRTAAFYPLTLPVTVGPGSISVAITLGANAPVSALHPLALALAAFAGIAFIALSIYVCYAFAERLSRLLGPTGMSVFLRLSSFILLCIGMQIAWNGISTLVGSLSR
jgi:multiple antibiotic resistance protein